MIDEKGTITGKQDDWLEICKVESNNNFIFNNCRKFNIVKLVADGYTQSSVIDYLLALKEEDDFTTFLNIWASNDAFMNPDTYFIYKGKKLTPATGRYAVNASNYIKFFGKDILNKNIAEIGAGWGSEMVFFNKVRKKYFPQNSGSANYTIFDLSTSLPLIKKFSKLNETECKFSNLSTINSQSYDLIVSNGAFSEMGRDLQEEYFNKVISKSKNGYFITNFSTASREIGGWDTEDFIEKLKNIRKKNVKILNIRQYISEFDYKAGSKLIVFGENINMKTKHKNKTLLHIFNFINLAQRISNKINLFLINKLL